MKKLFSVSILLITFAIGLGASAQTKPVPKSISGGILNGKAVSLPKPVYPADAAAAKVSGQVKVEVLIDEAGKVVSATAVSGLENVSLRQAAEAAAMLATFLPTKLSGQPVKVKGVIVYNFVAEKSNEERTKMLTVSTFLSLVRIFAADLDKLNKILEEDNLWDAAADFQEVPELSSLKGLEKLPTDKRIEVIDKTVVGLRERIGGSDRWQYEVGEHFGGLFGSLMKVVAEGGEPDIKRIDESVIKLHLAKIKDLTLSAPENFPRDILQKLAAFAAVGERDDLLTEAGLSEFFERGDELFKTISPDEK